MSQRKGFVWIRWELRVIQEQSWRCNGYYVLYRSWVPATVGSSKRLWNTGSLSLSLSSNDILFQGTLDIVLKRNILNSGEFKNKGVGNKVLDSLNTAITTWTEGQNIEDDLDLLVRIKFYFDHTHLDMFIWYLHAAIVSCMVPYTKSVISKIQCCIT